MKPPISFEEVYPDVKDIRVEHRADEHLDDPYTQPESLSASWLRTGPTLRCRCLDCQSDSGRPGCFDFTDAIREALGTENGVYETSLTCNGYKGNPRGSRRYHLPRCGNRRHFRFTVLR